MPGARNTVIKNHVYFLQFSRGDNIDGSKMFYFLAFFGNVVVGMLGEVWKLGSPQTI